MLMILISFPLNWFTADMKNQTKLYTNFYPFQVMSHIDLSPENQLRKKLTNDSWSQRVSSLETN